METNVKTSLLQKIVEAYDLGDDTDMAAAMEELRNFLPDIECAGSSMANDWGVFETWPEKDTTELHIVPMVDLGDGERVRSAAHTLDKDCPCAPVPFVNKFGTKVWNHHDPDHVGSLTDEEWAERKGRK